MKRHEVTTVIWIVVLERYPCSINVYICAYFRSMKAMKTKKKAAEKNWTMPGVKLTHEEFLEGIRKAEEGPFYTVEESMDHFDKWLKSREKK